ncbi:palladin isoform X1 [Ciona intestinalis]
MTEQSEKRDFFVAPAFYKPLQDLSTSQGECLVLECRVKGVPPPKLTWRREGDVIDDCPDFRILHRGEIGTLVIGEAFPEDSGKFTCEAVNKAGEDVTSCDLTVKGGAYHSIATKSPASPQSFLQPRPTQVLPAQPPVHCPPPKVITSQATHKPQTQISKLSIVPKQQPRIYVIGDDRVTSSQETRRVTPVRSPSPISTASLNVNVTPTSPTPIVTSLLQPYNRTTSPGVSPPCPSPSRTTSPFPLETIDMASYNNDNNADENHNFKTEKDQLVQQVSNTVTAPLPKQTKQRNHSSREFAIIQRDIEHRQAMMSSTASPITSLQEYKVSSFEQRLMNEIEYRLERSPPVLEDPEDGMYEDVPVEQQKPPVFGNVLKNFKAMDGTSTKFSCRVAAIPSAKVFWFKDGKQISKRSQHYIQRSDDQGCHELSIPHLCMEDDGNYTALATNPQGRVSTSGRLAMVSEKNRSVANDGNHPNSNVVRKSPTSPHGRRVTSPVITSPRQLMPHELPSPPIPVNAAPQEVLPEKGQLAADEESPIEKYYRPNFIQKPAPENNVEEGKLVRFDVKVTGLPLPEIEWFINGRPVRQDSLHKILVRENNVHSLLLERASPMDEGQYTVVATNKAGSATVNVQLHVAAREFMTPPAFVQRLAANCVAEGEPVRLEARVVATPRPIITWKKGSDQIMHDHRTQLYQDESGYVCLQISQTSLRDAAWYTCSATNKAGISSCNCKLDVYSPTCDAPSSKHRIRTPHRYANLAKVAGVDMREALTPDAQSHHILPESDDL